MKILGLRLNQVMFLIAGVTLLVSLPWLATWGVWPWLAANLIFLIGVILVLINK